MKLNSYSPLYIYIYIERYMTFNSEMSMFMYNTLRFWTRYYSIALLHMIYIYISYTNTNTS